VATIGLSLAQGATFAQAQRAALSVLLIRIGGAVLAYATQVLLARLMGKAEYGVFATVWVWLIIVGHGSLFGVGNSVCRFIPHHRARGELDLLRGFLAAGAAFSFASALLIAIIGAALLWLCRDLMDDAHGWAILFALLVLPLFALQDFIEGVARSFNWPGLAIAPPYIIRQGAIGLAMVTGMVLGAPAAAWVAILCALLATAFALVAQLGVLVHRLARELPKGPRTYRFRHWLKASVPMGLADLTQTALGFVDVLLLGFFLPAGEVAVYFAATRILQFAVFVLYAASTATVQRFAEAQARNDPAALRGLVTRTARLTTLATGGTSVLLLGAAPILLSLFGPGFEASFGPLVILIAGLLARAAFGPAEDVLNMLGQERLCALISVAALGTAVVLNLVLIPLFGIYGAAIAVALTSAGRSAALALAAKIRLRVSTHLLARG
jgi:O-antigen/teichoic acid export membrane protein